MNDTCSIWYIMYLAHSAAIDRFHYTCYSKSMINVGQVETDTITEVPSLLPGALIEVDQTALAVNQLVDYVSTHGTQFNNSTPTQYDISHFDLFQERAAQVDLDLSVHKGIEKYGSIGRILVRRMALGSSDATVIASVLNNVVAYDLPRSEAGHIPVGHVSLSYSPKHEPKTGLGLHYDLFTAGEVTLDGELELTPQKTGQVSEAALDVTLLMLKLKLDQLVELPLKAPNTYLQFMGTAVGHEQVQGLTWLVMNRSVSD